MSNYDNTSEGFSEAWLTLREPADHAARSAPLSNHLSIWAKKHSPLHCMELGAGTGSNLRYLCPRLGHDQHWTLIDNDPDLLEHAPRIIENWAVQNQYSCHRSNTELELKSEHFSARISWLRKDLAHDLAELPFDESTLICASALLDLTSATWLEQLATLCVQNQCAAMFALNYNGSIKWRDSLPEDQAINDLLNAHQLSDKGFGNALGPQAGAYFRQLLTEQGRYVQVERSLWELDTSMSELQLALIEGWAPAARQQDSSMTRLIDRWSEQRVTACKAMQSSLTVGHDDVLSLPTKISD